MRSVSTIRIAGLSGAILRAVFAVVFGACGFLLGRELYTNVLSLHSASEQLQLSMLIVAPVLGALVGIALAPFALSFFEDELVEIEGSLEKLEPSEIAGGAIGLVLGLGIALLVKSILFELISLTGRVGSYVAIALYVLVAIFCAYLGARVGARTQILPSSKSANGKDIASDKIVDTSVIIDGRIADLIATGFIEGAFIVPRFVLTELHALADSADGMKRARGRRGLDLLTELQEAHHLRIVERDYDDMPPGSVDAKLVRMARDTGAKLLTNDYNLNRVAHVEGVDVLNLNELAGALKTVVLPGEELHVAIIREGKEQQQGVAYLDDGTMIVIENGRRLIGKEHDVVVTSVLQTVAGRMVFARPKSSP